MDFNEDFDFEPAEDLKESIVDSKNQVEEEIKEPVKEINVEELNNIFTNDINKEINNEDFEKVSIFENKFNKLKEENDILNMNPELQMDIKRKTFFQKYAVILPIFAFTLTLALGVYIFTSNIKADETNLIKIEENKKYGYIDNEGNVVVRAKYIYGSDFYRGHAIVKNQNNLSGIINNKGNFESNFGDYFYIERFSNNYIVSKFTNEGLKMGLLNSSLIPITKFKYDNISYSKNNTFLFTRNDVMGVINQQGKEIFSFAVDETDDKDISIEVSNSDTSNLNKKYAKIKINKSSTIINLGTGKEIYSYTLDDINVMDNNVFYIKRNDENNKFLVIEDDRIKYETTMYKLVRVEDFSSGILVCLKNDMSYDYIDLDTKKVINKNSNISYSYGSGLILENKNDFEKNIDKFWIKNTKRTLGEFENKKLVDKSIVNGMIKVYTANNKINFLNTSGKLISEKEYDRVSNFDEFGYAIVEKDNMFGVIDKKGKEVIPVKYENIKSIDSDLFKNMKEKYNKEIFTFTSGNKTGIITSKGDIIIKASYDSFRFITSNYPIIVGVNNEEKNIINIDKEKEFNIKIDKDIEVHDNYILVDEKYYNYDGKLIYKLNRGG